MRHFSRSLPVGLLIVGASLPLSAPPHELTLTATALYLGGTFNPISVPKNTPQFIADYVQNMGRVYVQSSGLCTGGDPGCVPIGVYTPEQFLPVTGLRDMTFDKSVAAGLGNLVNCLCGLSCVVTGAPFTTTVTQALRDTAYTVISYSQSGTIASIAKRGLITEPASATVSFAFAANPNRPNGGILERFSGDYIRGLGVTFSGATPTNSAIGSPLTTVDLAGQYDAISDFPTNPLNLLADLNALLGYFFIHPRPTGLSVPELQGQYQDSTYYLAPTTTLPLLIPLKQVPLLGPLLAGVLDPPLRVLVEAGYDRTINPGAPTRVNLRYAPDPVTILTNVARAIPVGLDNGIAYLTGNPANRPLGTTAPGPYGVGGGPVYVGAVEPYGPPTPLTPRQALKAARIAQPPGGGAPKRPESATRGQPPLRPAADQAQRARPLPARATG